MKNKIQIGSAMRRVGRVLTMLCVSMVLLLPVSCIREEGRDECDYESLLYIVVKTESTEFDSSVDGATMYLFDQDGTLMSSRQISAEDIANKVPIPITYARNNLPWVVVWGNMDDREHFIMPTTLETMENMYVSMVQGSDGYTIPADNLFYGAKKLSGEQVEEVVISPKTGMLGITARGIAGDPSDQYYFTIESPYDKYDFYGTPFLGEVNLNLPGEFRNGDLVSPDICHIFHFPDPLPEEKSLTVKLYRISVGESEPILLATADTDISGDPIVILREKKTNVLINIEEGGIEIIVIITDWGQIVQWNDW